MKIYYVYILRCADDSYYTGFTSNLEKRMIAHQNGNYTDSYTYSRRPIKLMFYTEFTEPHLAIATEKQIKKWSRAKKEALIRREYDSLCHLSKKKFTPK